MALRFADQAAFWASAYGIALMILMLLAGGFLQGADMQTLRCRSVESIETVLPIFATQSCRDFAPVAHFIFAYHFV